ncbi:MarR family winged helix-turn-helix transcriptional regulator [Neobacillus sp. NPDC058068]|uniref:MarR family winged helix-turn-helix transcriptional regulator n=1 Tax=Neobacillus sp. NPDC058068 TaxID=3346325 RepID=UPI0036DDA0E4
MSKGEKPIGYWLKEADKSISAKVNKNLEQYNLTRLHWQVLNTVYEKDEITKEAIFDLLRNFVDESYLSEILNNFTLKNWMNQLKNSESGTTLIQMTEEGKVAFTEILSTQQKTRMQLFQGITNEEYEITVKVLKQLIDNATS